MSVKQKKELDETPNTRGDLTRENLVKSAMRIFARDGFDAASTRTIADDAGVNQALISYHFRNKNGLYLAVFENIVKIMRLNMGNSLDALQGLIQSENADEELVKSLLFAFCDNAIDVLVNDEMNDIAKLILREQQTPTEAFDIIYDGFMVHVVNSVCNLVGRLRPDFKGEDLKIKTITMFTQVVAMRAGRATIMRYLGWDKIGKQESQKLKNQIRESFNIYVEYGGRNA